MKLLISPDELGLTIKHGKGAGATMLECDLANAEDVCVRLRLLVEQIASAYSVIPDHGRLPR